MNHIPLADFVDKYLTDSLTAAEEADFLALLESAEHRDTLRGLIDAMSMEGQYVDTEDPAARETGYQRLQRAILALDAVRPVDGITTAGRRDLPGKTGLTLRLRWLSAAAAAVLLLVAGSYLLFRVKQPLPAMTRPVVLAKAEVPIIPPGSNRAVLQLANGQTVLLDSAQNGLLAQQGGVRVLKLNNGEVRYQEESAASASLYNTIATPRGGQYRLVLPDGTRVWLNAASSLRFPCAFSGRDRTVSMTGEVYFEVADDAKRPFRVLVDGVTVNVLGTHFNVMAYGDEQAVKTTLLEGAVGIEKDGGRRLLHPGQQASLDKTTNAFSVDWVDVNQVIAWKNGFFQFEHMDLGAIMRQISRWYDVDVHYDGIHTDDRFGGGISRTLDLNYVLRMLETNGVHFTLENKTLTVTP